MKNLGKFEIIGKVGQGAMGVVYKARDPFIGRLVALKTITTGLGEDPALLERFYQEARSAGGLQHPNIVTIYELGKQDDTPFIAMEFLEGESLDKVIERQLHLPLSQKLGYIVHVCRALEYSHKRGVVHRDIKPGNVMVTTEGTVKVVDFGIARLGENSKSQSGLLIGTLGYMSPQQIRGIRAEARSDIWAVGIMFYELLAGQRPFNGDNQAALMMNIIMQELPKMTEAAPGTPSDVVAVVERMLKKEIEERFQSMEDVLLALDPIWRRLQQAEVSGLVEDGQNLYEAHDLTRAQDLLRKALQIDTANTQAKNLLEKVNAEIKRSQILPQVKGKIEKAQNLLAAGQFDEAKLEAESALHLDSTFQPARELLAQVQAAAERARVLAQALRTSKQRLAEGAFTEAELQLDKVLAMDSSNAAALELLKQLRDEKTRRERQRKLSEILNRARTFWTNLNYEECIKLLVDAQKELPNEPEIIKLLETARQDQAEQQKQSLLAHARSLLGAQRFEEALGALDRVLETHPNDPTARNLRTLVAQERQKKDREQRFKEDLAILRGLVKEEKFPEAVARGEKLLQEFPKEFELAELLAFARSEHARLEHKRRLDQWQRQVNEAIKASRFPDAIHAAESALGEFPQNMDLVILLDRAKKLQREKENQDELERRIKEVKGKINREELTDAIDLARQTLVTLGPDTDITQLLHQAEMEYEQREKKKRKQQETVASARTLVETGKLGEATMVLKEAMETRLLSASDPSVTQILKQIDAKQKEPPPPQVPAAPPTAIMPAASSPSATSVTKVWPAQTGEPAKDYVYQKGAPPLPEAPSAPQQEAASATMFSATSVTGPSVQPVLPPPPPPAVTEKKPAAKPPKEKPKKEIPPPAEDFGATKVLRPTTEDFGATKVLQPPTEDFGATKVMPPATEDFGATKVMRAGVDAPPASATMVPRAAPPSAADKPLFAAPTVEEAKPEAAAVPVWKKPIVLGGAGAALVAVIVIAMMISRSPSPKTPAEPTGNGETHSVPSNPPAPPGKSATNATKTPEPTPPPVVVQPGANAKSILAQAETELASKNWKNASQLFQHIKSMKDADSATRSKAAEELTRANAHVQEEDLLRQATDAKNSGNVSQAKQYYQQVVNMRLDHQQEAENGVRDIDAAAAKASNLNGMKDQIRSAIGRKDFNNANQLLQQFLGAGGQDTDGFGNTISEGEKSASAAASANAAAAAETNEFNKAQSDYQNAVSGKNMGALQGQVTQEFQRVASSGGAHASQAQSYLNSQIPAAIKALTPEPLKAPPPPPVVVARPAAARVEFNACPVSNGGLGSIKAGQLIDCAGLDSEIHVQGSVSMDASGLTLKAGENPSYIIQFVVKEDGSVDASSYRPIGSPPPADVAVKIKAAAASWKMSPPPTARKFQVKAHVSFHITLAPQ